MKCRLIMAIRITLVRRDSFILDSIRKAVMARYYDISNPGDDRIQTLLLACPAFSLALTPAASAW